jgi:hypothetical protein
MEGATSGKAKSAAVWNPTAKRSWQENSRCVMETIIWLGITVAVLLLVWAAAPHHARMVENRDTPKVENWD